MAQDKNKNQQEPDVEKVQLEKRIDEMMDPTLKQAPLAPETPAPVKVEPPAIDIFKDTKTAPQVSPELLKQIGINDTKTKKEVAVTKDASTKVEVKIQKQDEESVELTPETKEESSSENEDPTQATSDVSSDEPFDDPETERAVDEIASEDSDKLLDTEDSEKAEEPTPIVKTKKKPSIKKILKSWKFWLVLLLILVAVFAVPVSRYNALGLVYKPEVTLTILDAENKTPVSNADVTLHGKKAVTDGSGQVKIKATPGKGDLKISKKYYKTYSKEQFVGLKSKQKLDLKMTATGRQVPIKITDSITGEPIKDAEIKVLSTSAKTDKNGEAVIVVPASNGKKDAEISAAGFNSKKVTFVVTEEKNKNTFTITPEGEVYFLSNLSGNIDVVKSDLDGTNRQVVVQGTGKEDQRNTNLLASRDWRYLVLKARRDTAQASLYLIDTRTDKLTRIDTGIGEFELVGWHGHNFIYGVTRSTTSLWQSGRQALKTYDADKESLGQIDQTQAEGSATSHNYQTFANFYILEDLVTYTVTWNETNADLGSKKSSIRAASPTGQNKKDYQTFAANNLSFFQASLYAPQEVYYAAYDNNTKPSFYEFEDNKVTAASGVDQEDFNKTYPTYLISPSGKSAFWSDFRDGKNTLFIGSAKDLSGKSQIATLSDYAPYGWYTDNYLLVSKSSSELYVTTQKNFDP